MTEQVASQVARMRSNKFAPWVNAGDEQLAAHVTSWNAVLEATGLHLDHARVWGLSSEQMMAEAQKVQGRNKKRAGVKALVRKYGHESAERIVYKHSGRTIQ